MKVCVFLDLIGYFFMTPKLLSKFSTQFGQIFPEGKLSCPGLAISEAVVLVLGAAAFAFLGECRGARVFLGFASAAIGATGCSALASSTGLGITVFGLLVDFLAAGFLGFSSVKTIEIGCSALAFAAGLGVSACDILEGLCAESGFLGSEAVMAPAIVCSVSSLVDGLVATVCFFVTDF